MTARIRYELRVGTLVSRATAATFQIPVRRTAVPRNTVYRFRVPADRDLTHVLHRLTEHHVRVLEIRRCPEPARRVRTPAPLRQEERPPETATPDEGGGVVVPLTAHRLRRSVADANVHAVRTMPAGRAGPTLATHTTHAHPRDLAGPSPENGAPGSGAGPRRTTT